MEKPNTFYKRRVDFIFCQWRTLMKIYIQYILNLVQFKIQMLGIANPYPKHENP